MRLGCVGLGIHEDRSRHPSDAVGIGHHVDLDDLAFQDGETHDGVGPSVHGDDDAGGSVHERPV